MLRYLSCIIFILSFIYNTTLMSQNALIIGHRGSSYTMPENTVLSAVRAWEEGADAVEIDVYPTLDHQIAVIHDKSTTRTTGEEYMVTETDSKILSKLDAGKWKDPRFKGEKLPMLQEVMEVIPRYKKLVIEVKSGTEIIPILEEMLDDHSKRQQIIFIAFGWDVIIGLKESFPDLPCFWLSANKADVSSRWDEIVSSGLDGINLHHSIVDKALIERAHTNQLGILCWTVNKMEDVRRLINIGIDGITTDRPGYIRGELLKDMDFSK